MTNWSGNSRNSIFQRRQGEGSQSEVCWGAKVNANVTCALFERAVLSRIHMWRVYCNGEWLRAQSQHG